jgi:hypothetical protein
MVPVGHEKERGNIREHYLFWGEVQVARNKQKAKKEQQD